MADVTSRQTTPAAGTASRQRATAGLALIGAIIGEFISSDSGLGHAILIAGSLYDVPTVLANLIVVGFLSLALLGGVGRLERVILRWRFLALSGE